MKKLVVSVLDKTLGRTIRLLQGFKQDIRVVNINPALTVNVEVQNRAVAQSVDYVLHKMQNAIACQGRTQLWNFCLSKVQGASPVFFEFGVHKGESINYISARYKFSEVHGFDSFHGLEEDWSGYYLPKGNLNLHGKLPKVSKNVNLVAGWFEDTLPNFLVNNPQIRTVGLLHMDADTYKPTRYVLDTLHKLINPGTVIIFDEYFGYNNWQSHEFKAFQEFVEKYAVSYTYIAFSDMQVGVQIN